MLDLQPLTLSEVHLAYFGVAQGSPAWSLPYELVLKIGERIHIPELREEFYDLYLYDYKASKERKKFKAELELEAMETLRKYIGQKLDNRTLDQMRHDLINTYQDKVKVMKVSLPPQYHGRTLQIELTTPTYVTLNFNI